MIYLSGLTSGSEVVAALMRRNYFFLRTPDSTRQADSIMASNRLRSFLTPKAVPGPFVVPLLRGFKITRAGC